MALGHVASKKHGVGGATPSPAIRPVFLAHAHIADGEITIMSFDVIHAVVEDAVRAPSHVDYTYPRHSGGHIGQKG
jgi:hypothetical protein